MKKKVILVIFIFMSAYCLHSQTLDEDRMQPPLFEFGVKGALSLPSYIWFEDLSWNQSTLTAFMPAAWFFADINITREIAFQIEAGYNGKGAYITASDGSLSWLFHYVEIPVSLKYNLDAGESTFWISGGGYFGMFLGGSYDFNVPGSEWTESGMLSTGSSKVITEVRPYDYGLVFGCGIESDNLIFEIKMPFGLTSVIEFTPADSSYGGYREAINSGVIICAGYKF